MRGLLSLDRVDQLFYVRLCVSRFLLLFAGGVVAFLRAIPPSHPTFLRAYVWNSASSELFMIGKSSLLAELGFAPDCQLKILLPIHAHWKSGMFLHRKRINTKHKFKRKSSLISKVEEFMPCYLCAENKDMFCIRTSACFLNTILWLEYLRLDDMMNSHIKYCFPTFLPFVHFFPQVLGNNCTSYGYTHRLR